MGILTTLSKYCYETKSKYLRRIIIFTVVKGENVHYLTPVPFVGFAGPIFKFRSLVSIDPSPHFIFII